MNRHKFSELKEEFLRQPGAEEALEHEREVVRGELSLAELRRALSFTQKQLATTLETTQPGVSRIEHQTDVYVSTLRSYVEALGGNLEIKAVFANAEVSINSFESLRTDEPREDDLPDPTPMVETDKPVAA